MCMWSKLIPTTRSGAIVRSSNERPCRDGGSSAEWRPALQWAAGAAAQSSVGLAARPRLTSPRLVLVVRRRTLEPSVGRVGTRRLGRDCGAPEQFHQTGGTASSRFSGCERNSEAVMTMTPSLVSRDPARRAARDLRPAGRLGLPRRSKRSCCRARDLVDVLATGTGAADEADREFGGGEEDPVGDGDQVGHVIALLQQAWRNRPLELALEDDVGDEHRQHGDHHCREQGAEVDRVAGLRGERGHALRQDVVRGVGVEGDGQQELAPKARGS